MPFPSWEMAFANSIGYQNDQLVENLANNLRSNPPWINVNPKVLNTRIMELMAAVQYVVRGKDKLVIKVADVGGGNGYMGVYMSKLFPEIKWEWTVYESPEVAKAYCTVLEQLDIIAFAPINDLFKKSGDSLCNAPDIILMSGALQYIEEPYVLLDKILKIAGDLSRS